MPEYQNLKIETNDGVYAPAEDSYLAASFVGEYLNRIRRKGLDIIDVGTGTGILGLSAARNKKVGRVLFSDINSAAVDLAGRNYESNKDLIHAKCVFRMANLFSGIQGHFDIIIFNAPYLRREGRKTGDAWWDGGREGIEVSLRFLKESAKRLNNGGSIFLVCSSLSNKGKLLSTVRDLGLDAVDSRRERFFFEEIAVLRIEKAYSYTYSCPFD